MIARENCCIFEKVNTIFTLKIGAGVMCSDRKVIDGITNIIKRNNRVFETQIFVYNGQWNFLQYITARMLILVMRSGCRRLRSSQNSESGCESGSGHRNLQESQDLLHIPTR